MPQVQKADSGKQCTHCEKSISRDYFKCNFCGQRHCGSHRLPENHDCLGLKLARHPELETNPSGGISPEKIAAELSKSEGLENDGIESSEGPDHPAKNDTSDDRTPAISSTSEWTSLDIPEDLPGNDGENIRKRVEAIQYVSQNETPRAKAYEQNKSTGYETIEPMVYSSAPEPDYESSPDVAVDGSVKIDDREESPTVGSSDPEISGQSTRTVLFVAGILLLLIILGVGMGLI